MTPARILVVEDEAIIAMELEDRLTRLGYAVIGTVTTGEAALYQIAAQTPDLALMDIRLAGARDGVETAGEIKARFDLPVIYLTAYADEATLRRATLTEPYGYLLKPFQERELRAAIEMALHKHRLEKQLRQTTQRLSLALQAAQAGVWEWDIASNQAFWSDENYRVMGLEPGAIEATYENWLDLIHPADRAQADAQVDQAVAELKKLDIQYRVVWPDGNWRWMRNVGEIEYGAEDRPRRMRGLQIDITARKQTELDLQASEARYRALIEQASDGIFVSDAQGNHLDVNSSACEMLGYTREELLRLGVYDLVPAEDRAVVASGMDEMRAGGTVRSERHLRCKDGTLVVVEISAKLLADGRMQAIARDITARKLAEARLKKLSSAIEQTAEPVIITDLAGTIEYVNAAFTAVTGYSAEEALGQTPRLLKSGIHPRAFYEKLWATILSGNIWKGTFANNKKSGEAYFAETTITPIHSPEDRLTHFVSVEKDITERIQREREMEAVVHVSAALRTAVSLAEMLPIILDQTIAQLDMAGAALALRDPATGETALELAYGDWQDLTGLRLPPGEGLTGLVIATGQAYVSADVYADPRHVLLDQHGHLQAAACMPLIAHEETIGALWVGRATAITPAEVRLLTAISDIAANAIYRTTLYEQERRRLRESEAMAAISRALNEALDLDRVLQMIAEAAHQLIHKVVRSVIHRYDEQNQFLRPVAVAGLTELGQAELRLRPGEGIAGLVLVEGRMINVADTHTDPRYLPLGVAAHLRSLLVTPVQSGARLFGTLSVQSAAPHAFTADDERLLTALSIEAAITIENAQLYAEQRRLLREREQAQAQLIHTEKMAALGRLVASLAHEINNPLQAVQGCLTLSREELADARQPEKIERYLSVAATEIDRIAGIVQRMRDFYRPARTEMQAVNLTAVLDTVLTLTHKQLQHANVVVARHWAADLPEIQANPDHLKQVFLNLLLNAIDAMPEGGELRLGAERATLPTPAAGPPQPAVRLEFHDTGRGMPPEILSHIFEPFFTAKDSGTGLGLSVSYGIIQMHNGQITATSQVNQGTRFSIVLPVNQPEERKLA